MISLSKSNFNFLYAIGRGGFGKVWKVEHKKTKLIYAMKEMSKSRVLTKKSVNSVMNERNLLSSLRNPFLVNMIYAFQDRDNLYLVMDLMTGGDLRYHICKHRWFSEEQSRFMIACVLIGLEYLHSNGILHRDIKPENLVFCDKGYVHITDLGIARVWRPENADDTSGTPGYMAPEVMCRQNHGVAVDYFAVGVMAYEMMMGRRPYQGKSRKEIRDAIMAKQAGVKKADIPEGWSTEAADFINKTLQRKPQNRLGLNGPEEVRNHPWFKNFNWDKLISREMESPFIPSNKEEHFDAKYANAADPWKDENSELLQQNALLLRRNSVQACFDGYDFDPKAIELSRNFSKSTAAPSQSTSLGNSRTKMVSRSDQKVVKMGSLNGAKVLQNDDTVSDTKRNNMNNDLSLSNHTLDNAVIKFI